MKKFFISIISLGIILSCGKREKKMEEIEKTPLPQIRPEEIKIDTIAIKDTFMPKGYPYQALGRPDPLKPLVGATFKEKEKEIDLSTLKLVGILKGNRGNAALFEGSDGRAYFIREKDKVRGGYVKSITSNEVIVEITAYGTPIEVRYSLRQEE
ncbi:MAG: hypothetical protein ABIM60_05990 [candidate division WOR-3 bacterium]